MKSQHIDGTTISAAQAITFTGHWRCDPVPYLREVIGHITGLAVHYDLTPCQRSRVVFDTEAANPLARFYDAPLGKPWSAEGERRFRVFENGKFHDRATHEHMRHLMYLWNYDAPLAASILDGRVSELIVKRSVAAVREAWSLR